MDLRGKTIIVTGSGRGIGEYIAKRLGREGANIVVTARNEKNIERVAREINDTGGKAIPVRGDVTREEDVKNAVDRAISEFGRIDVLVNNAGAGVRKYLWETSAEEFEEIMDVNVKGVFFYMKYAIPRMREHGGLVINISSGAGRTGIPMLGVYSASKFAVIGLTEAAAGEVGRNIKIITLCPASVDIGMFRRFFPGEKAMLRPEDVAEKIVDICVHLQRYRSGEAVEIY